MLRSIISCLVLLLPCALSCCMDDNGSQKGPEDGGNMAGDWDDCEILSTVDIAWEKATDIGTPKDVFARVSGSCESIFKWDGSGWNDGGLTITPATGEGAIKVTVEVDQQTAKFVTEKPSNDGYGDVQCNNHMSIEALVTIDLLGSELATRKKTTLIAYAEDDSRVISLSFDEDDLLAWVGKTQEISISLKDDVKGSMSVRISPIETACVGEAYLQYESSMGDGTASAALGPFGGWSDTGCTVGEEPVDLNGANTEFGTVLEQIQTIWGENSYGGKWDDGAQTNLDMYVSTLTTDACISNNRIDIPVQIRYSTKDERLQDHTTEGDLSVSINSNGSIRTSQLDFSDDRICEDEQDTIGYNLATCEELESITIQMGITRGGDGFVGVSDEGLMIYEYDRISSASPGEANRVRIFEFDL